MSNYDYDKFVHPVPGGCVTERLTAEARAHQIERGGQP